MAIFTKVTARDVGNNMLRVTREFDGRGITDYLGLLEEVKDVQPEYGQELVQKLAGWAMTDPEKAAVVPGA